MTPRDRDDASSIVPNESNATPLAIDRYHPLWDYLPKDIQAEEEKAEKYKAYLLAEIQKLQQGTIQRQESIAIWREQNLRYTPEDMLGDREWEYYYPAIKHTNDPLIGTNPLRNARERTPRSNESSQPVCSSATCRKHSKPNSQRGHRN